MKPSRRDLTLKGLERTLNQIFLENYALQKVRPYASVEEENNGMLVADGGEGERKTSFQPSNPLKTAKK